MKRVCIIPFWETRSLVIGALLPFAAHRRSGDEIQADCRFRDESLAEGFGRSGLGAMCFIVGRCVLLHPVNLDR